MKVKNERLRPKNQRVSNTRQRRQQHLLDVRVRSHKATQHRNRRILVVLSKIVLVLALGIGVFLGIRFGAKRFFFENPDYQRNDGSRCYHCKSELYDQIIARLPELGVGVICSGANLDDLGD